MKTFNFNHLLYRKLWVVMIISIICSSIATLIFITLNPIKYESSTSFYITNKNIKNNQEVTYLDMLASKSMVNNFEQIVKSEMFAKNVIQKLNLSGVTPQFISSQIESKSVKNSNILEIKVLQKDKLLSRKIAEVAPTVLSDMQFFVPDSNFITVLNQPKDAKPLYSGIIIIAAISFFAGIFLALAALLIFKPNSNIIRTPEDVEKTLGLVVTGTIPDFTF